MLILFRLNPQQHRMGQYVLVFGRFERSDPLESSWPTARAKARPHLRPRRDLYWVCSASRYQRREEPDDGHLHLSERSCTSKAGSALVSLAQVALSPSCSVQVTSPTIHWTLPYERGSEGVSLAISRDEGLTWQKDRTNPVVAAPPEDLQVTGFRDPSLSSLPSLDSLLGRPRDQYLYATLSGGIVEKSPTVFLYSIPVDNLRDWQSLGAIVDIGLDYTPDEKWCGEGGRNFECCSLFELETQTTLITSTEGGKRRWSLWLQGEMSVVDGRPKLEYTKSGVLDWGSFYAASTGQHPVDGRHLIMGKSMVAQ